MFTMKTLFTLCLVSGLALACQSEPASETGEMTEVAVVDVEGARAAIDASNAAWSAAAMAGDAAALAALHTDDATVLAPDAPRASGQAEILALFEQMFTGITFESMSIEADDVTVSPTGETAYVVGSFHDSGALADGTPFTDTGKYITIFENVDGEWKIALDAWNSDGAPVVDAAAEVEATTTE